MLELIIEQFEDVLVRILLASAAVLHGRRAGLALRKHIAWDNQIQISSICSQHRLNLPQ